MKAEVQSESGLSRSRPHSQIGSPMGLSRVGSQSNPLEANDDQAEWARQEQEMMIRQQDQTIDTIAGTLNTIAEQAGMMGQEIGEHNEMLDDLERGVDSSGTKLDDAMRRMRKFIRQTEETKSGWCIVILIIILMALLLAVILV
ncbi:hypothetical protein AcV5_002507 [Taiwanofungus camphoratus]|nr:hypothetical protein AcV5_002507 [Antrodia cinnamomea]